MPNPDAFTCPICFDDYGEGEGIMLMECLHTFCRWLEDIIYPLKQTYSNRHTTNIFRCIDISVYEDSKILSDIWSVSRLKVVGPTQKQSAMQAPQKTKKRHFILTPLDFWKLLGFRSLKFGFRISIKIKIIFSFNRNRKFKWPKSGEFSKIKGG